MIIYNQSVFITVQGTEVPALESSHYWIDDMFYPLSVLAPTSSQDSDMGELSIGIQVMELCSVAFITDY